MVIVGTGPGGVWTARSLRAEGFTGRIVMVGVEREDPYDRPPLSKGLLAGTAEVDNIVLLSAADADAAGIELLRGWSATRLDLAEKHLILDDGAQLDYDALVLATGARAIESPWGMPPGVHLLRSLADARALRDDLYRGGPVVVVGAGFIGAEVAAIACARDQPVTLVDPLPAPMARVMGESVGNYFGELHRAHGVDCRFGVGVEGITTETDAGGVRVLLTDGSAIDAATVLIGIGAHPATGWLADSGLLIDDGVICDEFGKSSAPNVYAVGDVARWHHPGRGGHVRTHHWTTATAQGASVAKTLMHPAEPVGAPPLEYVWTDQYHWRAQVLGVRDEDAEPALVIGPTDPRDAHFVALFGDRDGRCTGAVVVNWPRALIGLRKQLRGNVSVDDARLALPALSDQDGYL